MSTKNSLSFLISGSVQFAAGVGARPLPDRPWETGGEFLLEPHCRRIRASRAQFSNALRRSWRGSARFEHLMQLQASSFLHVQIWQAEFLTEAILQYLDRSSDCRNVVPVVPSWFN